MSTEIIIFTAFAKLDKIGEENSYKLTLKSAESNNAGYEQLQRDIQKIVRQNMQFVYENQIQCATLSPLEFSQNLKKINVDSQEFANVFRKFTGHQKLTIGKKDDKIYLHATASYPWSPETVSSITQCAFEVFVENPSAQNREEQIPLTQVNPPSQPPSGAFLKTISTAVIVLLALLISLYSPAIRSMVTRIYGTIRSKIIL